MVSLGSEDKLLTLVLYPIQGIPQVNLMPNGSQPSSGRSPAVFNLALGVDGLMGGKTPIP